MILYIFLVWYSIEAALLRIMKYTGVLLKFNAKICKQCSGNEALRNALVSMRLHQETSCAYCALNVDRNITPMGKIATDWYDMKLASDLLYWATPGIIS